MIPGEPGRLNVDVEDLEDGAALQCFLAKDEVDGIDEMHSHQFRRRLEELGFGGEGRMGAKVAIFAEAVELSPRDLADRLGIICGVL